jgi:hypothetical protein
VWDDTDFQDRYARLRLDLEDLKALYGTHVAKLKRGERLGPDVSMLKVVQTELFQRITDTMLEIGGENAGLLEPMEGNRDLNVGGLFIQARPATIYGGSNEIQRNNLTKNLLGLPGRATLGASPPSRSRRACGRGRSPPPRSRATRSRVLKRRTRPSTPWSPTARSIRWPRRRR